MCYSNREDVQGATLKLKSNLRRKHTPQVLETSRLWTLFTRMARKCEDLNLEKTVMTGLRTASGQRDTKGPG